MGARERRGRAIAANRAVRQRGESWGVPSQSGNGAYLVNPKRDYCSCPDHAEAGFACKHVRAVRLTPPRAGRNADGATTTTALTAEARVERKAYRQGRPSCNAARVNGYRHLRALLADLCRAPPAPAPRPGRPPVPPPAAALAAASKAYSTTSARRLRGELGDAGAAGHVSRAPHSNGVPNSFDSEGAAGIPPDFIARSAAPLAEVESQLAADSTGLAGGRYAQWVDEKWGTPKRRVAWVELHAMAGTRTHAVTSARAPERGSGGATQFPGLVAATAERFTVGEVGAGKAYLCRTDFAAVDAIGGTLYPAFEKSGTGGVGGPLAEAYHPFALNREEYGRHYRRRSGAGPALSMVGRESGESLRAKAGRAVRSEALARVVAHAPCGVPAAACALGASPVLDGGSGGAVVPPPGA